MTPGILHVVRVPRTAIPNRIHVHVHVCALLKCIVYMYIYGCVHMHVCVQGGIQRMEERERIGERDDQAVIGSRQLLTHAQ